MTVLVFHGVWLPRRLALWAEDPGLLPATTRSSVHPFAAPAAELRSALIGSSDEPTVVLVELAGQALPAKSNKGKARLIHPRAIFLAPTHELSRQLSKTAKGLLHNVKLRVLCASQANHGLHQASAAKMASQLAEEAVEGDSHVGSKAREVDVIVGTPSKILEMVRGHGWDYDLAKPQTEEYDEDGHKIRSRKFVIGEREASLERVEWVVVDEADVLFGALPFPVLSASADKHSRPRLRGVDQNAFSRYRRCPRTADSQGGGACRWYGSTADGLQLPFPSSPHFGHHPQLSRFVPQ